MFQIEIYNHISCYNDVILDYWGYNRRILSGLPVHGLTEIYGASSSGKTQIALHLTLSALVQRDSDGQTSDAKNRKPHVVYICTEGAFPMKRFVQLLDAYKSEQETENEQENCEDRIEDRLLLRHESTVESLLECITVRLVSRQSFRTVLQKNSLT